jgi:uncharacterized protein with HEPN domain
MNGKCLKYLQDILDAAADIKEFVSGVTYCDFENSLLIQRAVEREFEIVGEALNRVSRIDEELFDSIGDARKIVGFRNIIAHGYDILESHIIWSAVSENLPQLVTEIQSKLKRNYD